MDARTKFARMLIKQRAMLMAIAKDDPSLAQMAFDMCRKVDETIDELLAPEDKA